MKDKELLELAAKASGYDALAAMYGWDEVGGGILLDANDPPETWNPLTDDGDALRLAVKLKLKIWHFALAAVVEYNGTTHIEINELINENSGNRRAATRRAIVRAAAEIGKEMK